MRILRNTPTFKSIVHQGKFGLYIHEYQAYDLLKKYNLPLVTVPLFLILEL